MLPTFLILSSKAVFLAFHNRANVSSQSHAYRGGLLFQGLGLNQRHAVLQRGRCTNRAVRKCLSMRTAGACLGRCCPGVCAGGAGGATAGRCRGRLRGFGNPSMWGEGRPAETSHSVGTGPGTALCNFLTRSKKRVRREMK